MNTPMPHASNFQIMKTLPLALPAFIALLILGLTSTSAQNPPANPATVESTNAPAAVTTPPDADSVKKATEWIGTLNLGDGAKAARVTAVIAMHLQAIRDWHNDHPYTTVPAGINPITGKPLSTLDRQMIADSAQPKSIHNNLMTGLRAELSPEQVEAILDKYTVGKVAFTLKGYHAIVPDLTAEEEKTILGFLKQAREEAVDYKSMPQISAIFEIYKTKSEQYLNSNGRDWKQLYKAYSNAAKARKAEAAKQKAAESTGAAKN